MNKDTMLIGYEDFQENEELQKKLLSDLLSKDSDLIEEGINIDKQETEFSINFTSSVEDNKGNVEGDFSILNKQINYQKQKNINGALRYVAREFKKVEQDSFYSDIEEYHGIIQDVNLNKKIFNAILTNIKDKNKILKVKFDIEDVQFESDKELIKIGAPLIWLIGQETQLLFCDGKIKIGPRKNVSKFIFRRTKVLTTKEKDEAKHEGCKWARFFEQCTTQDET